MRWKKRGELPKDLWITSSDNFASWGGGSEEYHVEDLKKLIQKSPKDFVAQEEVSLSTTPSFINGKIEPRYAAMRAFLVSDGDEYKVMQGGLTRSSAVKGKFEISNQLGGISKDTWIITDTPTEYQAALSD